jgi:hypothetical protein
MSTVKREPDVRDVAHGSAESTEFEGERRVFWRRPRVDAALRRSNFFGTGAAAPARHAC